MKSPHIQPIKRRSSHPGFYFGAAKLLLGESRPDSMWRPPFLISSGIVAARSKWIDDPITTRCLQSAARSAPRWQATWQRSPVTFSVNSWKTMTFATWLQIPLPMAPRSLAAKAQGQEGQDRGRAGPGLDRLMGFSDLWSLFVKIIRAGLFSVSSIIITGCYSNTRVSAA